MTKHNAVGTARAVLWAVFLFVSLFTGGLSLSPPAEFRLAGMFQAAFLFSGVAVVAVAEFHIQRLELSESATVGGFFLTLLAVIPTYYYVSALAAHNELAEGWLAVALWFAVFVGVTALMRRTKVEGYLLVGFIAFLIAGSAVLLVLGLWFWPKLYYEFIRPEGHLPWTPWLMAVVGLIVWSSLAVVGYRIRNAVQQRVPADRPASRGGG